MIEVRRYLSEDGRDFFGEWLKKLKDRRARAQIETRLTRLSLGNFGDCKPIAAGVSELRIHFGSGYRVYYGMEKQTIVLLLCGGDKRTQDRDIEKAIERWNDHRQRSKL